jgi:UDP-N-acetylglucosamine diphosphorylase/glucosamine-1-phosphate N-acetyltransferase
MNLILFDHPVLRNNLKPFTFTRPVAGIRCGIYTLGEKWHNHLASLTDISQTSYLTERYLSEKYPLIIEEDNLLVNASYCANSPLAEEVSALQKEQMLVQDGQLIAARISGNSLLRMAEEEQYEVVYRQLEQAVTGFEKKEHQHTSILLAHVWDIFLQNGDQITADFEYVRQGRSSQEIHDPHTIVYGDKHQIFIEEGVSIRASILNAENGPVYIGKNATVHENALIKGPFALLEGSHVNAGSKIREATTIGPFSKLGGEVKNVVVFGNSNKGHEGFLGNAVIGEWCNFGADTNASNLKNNYKPVKVWNYGKRAMEDSGELFCGLIMGDHSKCGINTMFNTGTVVGVSANIFGCGYPPTFIPSFTWGGIEESSIYQVDKALEVAQNVMQRRGLKLSAAEEFILRHIAEQRPQELKV